MWNLCDYHYVLTVPLDILSELGVHSKNLTNMITTDGNQLQTHACQCTKEETLSRLLKGMKSIVIYERVKKALNLKKKENCRS